MRTSDRALAAVAVAALILSLLAPAAAAASSLGGERGHSTVSEASLLDSGAWLARLHSLLAGFWPTPGDTPPTALFSRAGGDMDPNGTPSSSGTTESTLDGGGSWEPVAPAESGTDPNG